MTTQFTKCLLVFSLSLGVAACGLTGPLYMPPPEQPAAKQAPAQPETESTAADATTEAAPH